MFGVIFFFIQLNADFINERSGLLPFFKGVGKQKIIIFEFSMFFDCLMLNIFLYLILFKSELLTSRLSEMFLFKF